jgi:hypothetical protein
MNTNTLFLNLKKKFYHKFISLRYNLFTKGLSVEGWIRSFPEGEYIVNNTKIIITNKKEFSAKVFNQSNNNSFELFYSNMELIKCRAYFHKEKKNVLAYTTDIIANIDTTNNDKINNKFSNLAIVKYSEKELVKLLKSISHICYFSKGYH